jgi:signal transduction histidine kinase
MERELDRHIRGDAPNFEAEYRVRDSGGKWHIIVDRGRVVDRLPGGAPARLMGISADVTEARRVDASVKELETLAVMGRVAARVAHEINNPLAGIQYSFLLIKDAIPENHPHFSYVGAIEREITRIGAVTRQLYETYRPEQDTSAHTPLGTVVNDAVAFMQQVNRRTQVKIVTDLSGAPAVVSLSAAILRQVVYNLVQNAMDASPPGGTVRVTAVTVEDTLEIRVSDDGPGIAPEMHDRIFEPFFSTKDTQMRTSGMGLGLALVRRSVDAAGGRISIDRSPSGGALFIVTLPLDAVEVHA